MICILPSFNFFYLIYAYKHTICYLLVEMLIAWSQVPVMDTDNKRRTHFKIFKNILQFAQKQNLKQSVYRNSAYPCLLVF